MNQQTAVVPKAVWALVTGASSGIGAAIATELSAREFHLVLVARDAQRLDTLAQRLAASHGTETRTLAIDLTIPHAPQQVLQFTRDLGIDVEILVNNAGALAFGEFRTSDLVVQSAMVQLHCVAMLELAHGFVGPMVDRRHGRILIVATTTLAPAPYLTTYAATKGFDLLFAEGLAEEVGRHGVTVSALCPGPTQTGMAAAPNSQVGAQRLQSAADVATKAVDGLLKGRRHIRPSWMAHCLANLPRFLPRATVSGATEAYYRRALGTLSARHGR